MMASVRFMRPQAWTLMSSKPREQGRRAGLSGASDSILLATRFGHTLRGDSKKVVQVQGGMLKTYSRSLNSSSPWEEAVVEQKEGRLGGQVKLARLKAKMLT